MERELGGADDAGFGVFTGVYGGDGKGGEGEEKGGEGEALEVHAGGVVPEYGRGEVTRECWSASDWLDQGGGARGGVVALAGEACLAAGGVGHREPAWVACGGIGELEGDDLDHVPKVEAVEDVEFCGEDFGPAARLGAHLLEFAVGLHEQAEGGVTLGGLE